MDPYQPCPCGSGKSFKWCCQPFYPLVEKARQQHAEGQHETALRTVHQLVQQHPGSAPALGYEAEMLYLNGQAEKADEILQQAFAINPDFPFGHWLRGVIRKDEGEIIGALIQFRKAAELYDPKSTEVLAEVNAAIFDIEMRLNRPVAARAALERAIRAEPTAKELRQAFDNLFGPDSRLPDCAAKAYVFRPATPSRLQAWNSAVPSSEHVRLGEARSAFEKLVAEDASDAAAWFNLGLVAAWQGDHPKAVETLSRCVETETNAERYAEAVALIEVLRCGSGMEEQADYAEYRSYFEIRQPQPVIRLLEEWAQKARMSGVQQDQEHGTLSALVLEESRQFGVGVGAPVARLGAYLLIVANILRLWHPNKESVTKVADEIAAKLGPAVSLQAQESGYCNFSDIAVEAMLFPTRHAEANEIEPRMKEHAQSYFEESWVHRPLKALSGVPPIDAVGSTALQKRLPGVVRFVEDCFRSSAPRVSDGERTKPMELYDFNRLRHKLGIGAAPAAPTGEPALKIEAFSASELAGLDGSTLSSDDLDRAFRTALKLDARDLAGKFARLMTQRPPNATLPDRYPYFNHLMQLAQAENDGAAVMLLLDQAEKADADFNESRRHGDLTVRRGQQLAKLGDAEKAHEVFAGLLGSMPDDLKYYGPAIETMLGQKRGQWALEFAERGLAKARSQNNRDSEQYFMELAAAARRLV
jgi:tetratricopeptide (TPR) repeat protein